MNDRIPQSFAPGPTRLHPVVAPELARMAAEGYLSESHRSGAVRREVARVDAALRPLLGIPADHRILLVSSATEAMERLLQALRPPATASGAGVPREVASSPVGEPVRTLHLVNGAFARRFHAIARGLGLEAEACTVPDGGSFRAGDVEIPAGTALLALTQNETSTGARIPPPEVEALAHRARARGALVAADLVTGWPTEPVEAGWLDAGFFSVQKGFGLPAGLGVLVASPALVERARASLARGGIPGVGLPPGPFFHLAALADAADRQETVATPNTLAIRLLARVAEDYLAKGGTPMLARAAEAARLRWQAGTRALGLDPFVEDPELQSRTVAVLRCGPPETQARIRQALVRRGFVVGDGYGPHRGMHLRVAHFPVHLPPVAPEALQGALLEALRAAQEEVRQEVEGNASTRAPAHPAGEAR